MWEKSVSVSLDVLVRIARLWLWNRLMQPGLFLEVCWVTMYSSSLWYSFPSSSNFLWNQGENDASMLQTALLANKPICQELKKCFFMMNTFDCKCNVHTHRFVSVIFALWVSAATPGAGGMLVYRRVWGPAAERRVSGHRTCSGTQSTTNTDSYVLIYFIVESWFNLLLDHNFTTFAALNS